MDSAPKNCLGEVKRMSRKVVFSIAVLTLLLALTSVSMGQAPFKIGIITGTVSQSEDEYRGAEAAAARYPGMLIHRLYPDNFMQEQETFIAQITSLAADKDVKAIVINQGVPGTVAGIRKVRETRPDMIFVIGEPHEDPEIVERVADISLIPDNIARGRTIVEVAKKMGAKKLIHYSFPRHMSMVELAERASIMEQTCKELGLEFIFVNAPDPLGEGGLPATQQFILEDVPRQVATHGKDVAFFSTNCGMQEPLIIATLKAGAIFPEQCCPSPTHGYPAALGLEITEEMKGNFSHHQCHQRTDRRQGYGGQVRTGRWPRRTVPSLAWRSPRWLLRARSTSTTWPQCRRSWRPRLASASRSAGSATAAGTTAT